MGLLSDKIATLKLSSPLTVASGTSIRQVIEQIRERQAGCVLVCQEQRVIGIMTERDVLMKVVARDVNHDDPVDKFMTSEPVTLTKDRTIGEAITLMNDQDFRNIPIVDAESGEPIALFNVRDIIHHLAESFPEHVLNLPPRPHQKMLTPDGA